MVVERGVARVATVTIAFATTVGSMVDQGALGRCERCGCEGRVVRGRAGPHGASLDLLGATGRAALRGRPTVTGRGS